MLALSVACASGLSAGLLTLVVWVFFRGNWQIVHGGRKLLVFFVLHNILGWVGGATTIFAFEVLGTLISAS